MECQEKKKKKLKKKFHFLEGINTVTVDSLANKLIKKLKNKAFISISF